MRVDLAGWGEPLERAAAWADAAPFLFRRRCGGLRSAAIRQNARAAVGNLPYRTIEADGYNRIAAWMAFQRPCVDRH